MIIQFFLFTLILGSSYHSLSGYDNSIPFSSQGNNGNSHSNGATHHVGSRFLLREDDMTQLEFNTAGLVARSKQRRLLLLNDLLVTKMFSIIWNDLKIINHL